MDNDIIMVCGYKKTGKDTLYRRLCGDTSGWRWEVFSSGSYWPLIDTPERRAFATALREEVYQWAGVPVDLPDSEKDVKQYTHPDTREDVSARDLLITHGKYRRQQDIDYWCISAFPSDVESDIVVTDWRFPNELEWCTNNLHVNLYTARMFRADVDVPAYTIESEHALDDTLTDFLLLREGSIIDYRVAMRLFPEYRGYTPTGMFL